MWSSCCLGPHCFLAPGCVLASSKVVFDVAGLLRCIRFRNHVLLQCYNQLACVWAIFCARGWPGPVVPEWGRQVNGNSARGSNHISGLDSDHWLVRWIGSQPWVHTGRQNHETTMLGARIAAPWKGYPGQAISVAEVGGHRCRTRGPPAQRSARAKV